MAGLDLNAIKARNIDSLAADAPYNPDVWTLKADRDALIAEVERLNKVVAMLGDHLQGGAEDVKALVIEAEQFRADRDLARDAAVALEQQLAKIEELAYMGGQNGEVIRSWIIGVFEADRRAMDGGESRG